jgi:hypothetical protein
MLIHSGQAVKHRAFPTLGLPASAIVGALPFCSSASPHEAAPMPVERFVSPISLLPPFDTDQPSVALPNGDHRAPDQISGRVSRRASANAFDDRIFGKSDIEKAAAHTSSMIVTSHDRAFSG